MAGGCLPTIQMFWHGAPLSRMEQLSMVSFLRNGHGVDLYVYEEPAGVPAGVRVRDAAEILPRAALYRHRRTQSLAPFADWFRYRLLFERGGIWSDTDMVCLQPLVYASPVVFAWQDEQGLNSAILGLPSGDLLAQWMAECCEHPNRFLPYDSLGDRLRKLRRRVQGNHRGDVRFTELGPRGLTRAARHLGYLDRALPSWHFYPVAFADYRILFESPIRGRGLAFANSRAVHFWNRTIEKEGTLNKSGRFAADSPFEQLWSRYVEEGRSGAARMS
jgi:hypothetical protein